MKANSFRQLRVIGLLLPLLTTLTTKTPGQGVVWFDSRPQYLPDPPPRRVLMPDGTPITGPIPGTNVSSFYAQLLYQNNTGAWVAHPTVARFFTSAANAGFWNGGARTLVNAGSPAPGTTRPVNMQVRVWDAGGGSQTTPAVTFEQAVAGGLKWGTSQVFVYTEEWDMPRGTDDTYIKNFLGFTLQGCTGTVRMTRPGFGTALRAPASIIFEAEATGTPGTITNVFYSVIGGTPFGSATAAPFTVVATNILAGDFLIQAVAESDAGVRCGSPFVFVRVMDPPIVTVTPPNRNSMAGSNVLFTAVTQGSLPIFYQWYAEGQPLQDAVSPTLVVTNVNESTPRSYFVVASNAVGISTSAPVTISIRSILVLIDHNVVHAPVYTSDVPVTVDFITSYPRGSIFYTLDGSAPDFTSIQFAEPFTVNRPVLLCAIAYSANFLESGVAAPVSIRVPPLRFLSATTAGGGSLFVNPAGGAYTHGQMVQVTAQPQPGWTFLEWRGDISGANPSASLAMTRDRCIEAVFGTQLTTTVAGNGQIVLDPPGGLYPAGTLVRLYAVPQTNNYFVLWGNYASGSENPLSFPITMPGPQISSAFYPLGSNQVTLTVLPDGLGTVDILPRTNRYTRGQSVQIIAVPAADQQFLGWSGDLTSSLTPTFITLDSSKVITAHFSKTARFLVGPCASNFDEQGFYGTLRGAWGAAYRITSSHNLFDWRILTTITNQFGTTQFGDSMATNSPAQFYRAELVEDTAN